MFLTVCDVAAVCWLPVRLCGFIICLWTWLRSGFGRRGRSSREVGWLRRGVTRCLWGFLLPVVEVPVVHEVVMDESGDFEPRESVRAGEPDSAGVLLKEVDGRLRVEVVVTPFGMPRRWRRPPAVWL